MCGVEMSRFPFAGTFSQIVPFHQKNSAETYRILMLEKYCDRFYFRACSSVLAFAQRSGPHKLEHVPGTAVSEGRLLPFSGSILAG